MSGSSLIQSLEAAEGGSRELDALIHVSIANDPNTYVVDPSSDSILTHRPGWYRTGNDLSVLADPVTTSLDAALALAERVLPEVWWIAGRGKLRASEAEYGAQLMFGEEPIGQGEGATPALALCIAILRAREGGR